MPGTEKRYSGLSKLLFRQNLIIFCSRNEAPTTTKPFSLLIYKLEKVFLIVYPFNPLSLINTLEPFPISHSKVDGIAGYEYLLTKFGYDPKTFPKYKYRNKPGFMQSLRRCIQFGLQAMKIYKTPWIYFNAQKEFDKAETAFHVFDLVPLNKLIYALWNMPFSQKSLI